MALILDTNALSAFADGDGKLLRVVENETELAVPVVVMGEYLYGIRQSRFRAKYEFWLTSNLSVLTVIAIGMETARHYAEIRGEFKAAGQPVPSNDLWIAALAREHRLPLVSRDRHFQAVQGLQLLSW